MFKFTYNETSVAYTHLFLYNDSTAYSSTVLH